jgi:hypothetical protein
LSSCCCSYRSNSAQFEFYRSLLLISSCSIWAISFCYIANRSWRSPTVSYSNVLSCFLLCLNWIWNSAKTLLRFFTSFFYSSTSFFSFLFFCFISPYTLSRFPNYCFSFFFLEFFASSLFEESPSNSLFSIKLPASTAVD